MNNNGRIIFKKYKTLIVILCNIIKILPRSFRIKLFELHRNTSGKIGILIRYIYLKTLAKKCGDNVAVMQNVYFFNIDKLEIGNNVSFHPMCYIDSLGRISIGNNVSIAHGVSLVSFNHGYTDMNIPIKYQEVEKGNIVIEDNVWIGAKATVLCNVKIEEGSIVGANCVVTHNVKKNTIVGGIPNKVIKER